METFDRRPVRRRSPAVTIAIVIVAIGALAVVGVGLLALWGMNLVAEQVGENLRDNPVILDHLGTIESIDIDFSKSIDAPNEDAFVFNVEGSRGSGIVTAVLVTIDEDREEVVSGTLELASGETLDLFPEE